MRKYYYEITVTEHAKDIPPHSGVRPCAFPNVEDAYIHFRAIAIQKYGDRIEEFECKGLSEKSRLVKSYKLLHGIKERTEIPIVEHKPEPLPPRSKGRTGPGKYREGDKPKTKGFREG